MQIHRYSQDRQGISEETERRTILDSTLTNGETSFTSSKKSQKEKSKDKKRKKKNESATDSDSDGDDVSLSSSEGE